jgi:small subunit ribosomal protein S9
MTSLEQFYGTGRRKTATARVFIRPNVNAQGKVIVNHLPLAVYLPGDIAYITVHQPLSLLQLERNFDIYATVQGGGKSAQREAIRHGLTKAIIAWEKAGLPNYTPPSITHQKNSEESKLLSFYKQLRKAGLVTCDARRVERKKPGLHKARKRAPHVKR